MHTGSGLLPADIMAESGGEKKGLKAKAKVSWNRRIQETGLLIVVSTVCQETLFRDLLLYSWSDSLIHVLSTGLCIAFGV